VPNRSRSTRFVRETCRMCTWGENRCCAARSGRSPGAHGARRPSVANSGDGGKTSSSVRIAEGSGNFGSVGDLLDKDYVTARGDGNAFVTYGDFRLAQKGAFTVARVNSSVTHDGGTTWSKPRVISGNLEQAFVSIPTVAADGRIYVAFMNTTNATTGRDTTRSSR
jgi:hypothetical protein